MCVCVDVLVKGRLFVTVYFRLGVAMHARRCLPSLGEEDYLYDPVVWVCGTLHVSAVRFLF